MSLFGAIVRTTVNIVKLPVCLPIAVTKDVVTSVADVGVGECVGKSTKALIREIKEDAEA